MKCNLALWNVMGTAKVLSFFSRLQFFANIMDYVQFCEENFENLESFLGGRGALVLFRGNWYPLAVESKNKNKEKMINNNKTTNTPVLQCMDSQLKPPQKRITTTRPAGLQLFMYTQNNIF